MIAFQRLLFLIKSKQEKVQVPWQLCSKDLYAHILQLFLAYSQADVVSFGYRVLKIPCVQWEKSKVLIGSFRMPILQCTASTWTPLPPNIRGTLPLFTS